MSIKKIFLGVFILPLFLSSGLFPIKTSAATSELEDVYVQCLSLGGATCQTQVPEYCKSDLITAPLNGESYIINGRVVYTQNKNSSNDENYVHLREDSFGNRAKCFIKIVYDQSRLATNVSAPKTGLVGGAIAMLVAGCVAGLAVFIDKSKNGRFEKKSRSER
jgi:hypothetical protein